MKSARKTFNLTPRETDIARFAKRGRPLKEIADKLGTSHNTVRVQFEKLRNKIGAFSAQEAAYILSHYKV